MADLQEVIRGERLALIDFLETLQPDDWQVQSLCSAWRVQDVAAHLAFAPVQPGREVIAAMARGRFRLNQVNAENAVRWSARGTAAILDQLRTNVRTNAKPPVVPQEAVLADAVVHALDIRRPLGAARPIPESAFLPPAELFTSMRWPLSVSVGGNARKRIEGLRLVADDVGWSHGQGPEVHGSAEAMMLMLTGRAVGPDELTGPGADRLYARL